MSWNVIFELCYTVGIEKQQGLTAERRLAFCVTRKGWDYITASQSVGEGLSSEKEEAGTTASP